MNETFCTAIWSVATLAGVLLALFLFISSKNETAPKKYFRKENEDYKKLSLITFCIR